MSRAFTRRQYLQGLASLAYTAAAGSACAENQNVVYGKTTLPSGVRSRFLDNINGLRVHILEAGFEGASRPCVLLLHGFPEPLLQVVKLDARGAIGRWSWGGGSGKGHRHVAEVSWGAKWVPKYRD